MNEQLYYDKLKFSIIIIPTQERGNNMKKLLSVLLTLAMLFSLFTVPVSAEEIYIDQSSLGDSGVEAVFDTKTGVLTISGKGAYFKVSDASVWKGYDQEITEIVIEEGIEEIPYNAFETFYKLETITIPSTLSYINSFAFTECYSLSTVIYNGTEKQWGKVYVEEDGNKYFLNAKLNYDGSGGSSISYVITSFYHAPNGTIYTIGVGSSGSSLPSDVGIFYNNGSNSKKIPLVYEKPDLSKPGTHTITATAVPDEGFTFAEGLSPTFTFTVKVAYTGPHCGNNAYWYIYENGMLDISGSGNTYDYDNTTDNKTPWYEYRELITSVQIGMGVEGLGADLFADTNAESITFEYNQTELSSINPKAFRNAKKLKSFSLPYNTSFDSRSGLVGNIGLYEVIAYTNKTNTGSVVLESNTTKIADYAFVDCALTSVAIPPTVTQIGENAFAGCDSVVIKAVPGSYAYNYAVSHNIPTELVDTTITSITAPSDVTVTLGDTASLPATVSARDTYGISVDLPVVYDMIPSTDMMGTFIVNGRIELPEGYVLKAGLSPVITYNLIVNPATGSCGNNLTWSYDGSGVLTISGSGDMVFNASYAPWNKFATNITSVSLPEGLTTIADYAFANTNIQQLHIPTTVYYIGTYAFENSAINEFVVVAGNNSYSSEDGVLYDYSKATLVRYPIGKADSEFTVPDSVTSICANAFSGCTNLTKVTIGMNVANMENCGLENLNVTLVVPDGSAALEYAKENNLPYETVVSVVKTGTVKNLTYTQYSDGFLYLECDGEIGSLTTRPWDEELITSAEFAEGVTGVGRTAVLCNMPKLKTVKLPSTFADKDRFMSNCPNVERVIIPESNQRMFATSSGIYYKNSANAYAYLVEIFNTDKVFTMDTDKAFGIDENAFENNSTIEVINLMSCVQDFGYECFEDCTALKEINVIDVNEKYISSENGILYNANKTKLIKCPVNNPTTTLIIPDTVTKFGDDAFRGCKNLISVTMSDNVVYKSDVSNDGYRLFEDAINLESVRLSDNIEVLPQYIFNGCTKLKTVNMPASLKTVSYYAFYDCSSLTGKLTLPESVTAISDYSFYNTRFTEVEIPEAVTEIESGTFKKCTALTKVTFNEGLEYIWSYAFDGCTNLENVSLPSTLKTISSYAFRNCSAFTNINVSSGTIGSSAFSGCSNVTNVSVASGTIGNYAFSNCTALSNVTLGDNVTDINQYAFQNCTSLKEITIPAGVTTLRAYVFTGCDSLEKIVVEGATGTHDRALQGLISLKTIELPDTLTSITHNVFKDCSALENITLPKNLKSLGYSVFNGCTSLTSLDVPGTVDIISAITFEGSSIKEIKLNEGTTSIVDAFSEYTPLEKIYIPDSVTSIDEYAFTYIPDVIIIANEGSYALEYAMLNGLNFEVVEIPEIVQTEGLEAFTDVQINVGESIELPQTITGYTSTGEEVELEVVYDTKVDNTQASVQYISATIIAPDGYKLSSELQDKIRLTITVKEITNPNPPSGGGGGGGDTETVTWEIANKNVLVISGSGDMDNYTNEKGCEAPWLSYAEEITSVVVEKGVTSVGDFAFYGMYNVESIQLADTVTKIGTYAFKDTVISDIYLSENITEIGSYAFTDCRCLQSITLPKSITRIPEYLFWGCYGMSKITFNGTVSYVHVSAFENCSALVKVYYAGTEKDWANITTEKGNDCLLSATVICSDTVVKLPEITPSFKEDITTGEVNVTVEIPKGIVDDTAELIVINLDNGAYSSFTDYDVSSKDTEIGSISIKDTSVKQIKIFLWESLDTMMPLSQPVELTIRK